MRIDLHVHTLHSPCSSLSPGEVLRNARSRGLDGVCITDHDTMDIRRELQEGYQEGGLCVIFGMEYATSEGDFLLFGPFEGLSPGLPAGVLLERVDKEEGVAVAAHPFRSNRPLREDLIRQGACCIVEGINGRNSEPENLKVAEWRAGYAPIECGGSDAHTLEELGRVVTVFEENIRSRKDLIEALKGGRCKPQWNRAWSPMKDMPAPVFA